MAIPFIHGKLTKKYQFMWIGIFDNYFRERLYSSAKCEHKSKCDEECCSDQKKCLWSCLSLCHFFWWNDFHWSRSHRSYYYRSIELIGNTLIVSSCCAFFCCLKIDRMRNEWELEHSDHITIFLISLIESISCTDIGIEEFYLCWWRESEAWFWSSSCSRPYHITWIFPDSCFTCWSCRPSRIPEFYHIWSLLFILVSNENIRSRVGPWVKETCDTSSNLDTTTIKTLITTIDSKCRIWITVYCFVFTERRTGRRRNNWSWLESWIWRIHWSITCCRWERADRSHHHDSNHTERERSHK